VKVGTETNTPAEAVAEIGQLFDFIRDGKAGVTICLAQITPLLDDTYGSGPREYKLVRDFNLFLMITKRWMVSNWLGLQRRMPRISSIRTYLFICEVGKALPFQRELIYECNCCQ
jgi:hypothetical protein